MDISKISNRPKNVKDITDQRFGRLVALEPTVKRCDSSVVWLCACDCGNVCEISSASLRNRNTKSCGCLNKELVTKRFTTHGMRRTRIYNSWAHMIGRCNNPNNSSYKNYGGRGIRVCERWHKFENFYKDMGEMPDELTLERKNNNGNYEPRNCCWATKKEQARNRRPFSCGSCQQKWFYGHGSNGEMIIENNQHRVARIFGLSDSCISSCLSGKSKKHKGWTFRRIEDSA